MVTALLFILSTPIVFALPDIKENIMIAVDSAGILIGIVLIIFIIVAIKSFAGSLRKSFNYIMYGIIFQILALVLEEVPVIFAMLKLYIIPASIMHYAESLHHIFMTIGIIFFALATYNLRKMLSELNKDGFG